MSFQKMLTEKVDVYWLKEKSKTGSYGVPDQTQYYYDNVADIVDVPCYITNSGWKSMITQSDPHITISNTLLLFTYANVNIKLNDKIIYNNAEYRAKVPRDVRGHHLEIEMARVERQ